MLRRGARGGLGSGSFSPPPEVEGVRKTLQRDPCTTEAGLEILEEHLGFWGFHFLMPKWYWLV